MSTEKIILWDQGDFFHFLLANSLQKKTDAELYAIFDIRDKQKPFYQKQKFVEYKKIWFFTPGIRHFFSYFVLLTPIFRGSHCSL